MVTPPDPQGNPGRKLEEGSEGAAVSHKTGKEEFVPTHKYVALQLSSGHYK